LEGLKLLGIALFIGAWFLMAASWFYVIYEQITVHLFKPSSFNYGKLVLKLSESIPRNQTIIQVDQVHKTENGKFKFINLQECLFCSKYRIFAWHTPFPIKGVIRWHNGIAEVEGRIPLGTTLFFSAWLVDLTVGGLLADFSNLWHPFAILGFITFGWFMAGAMYFISVPIEVRRARTVFNEFKQFVASRPSR